MDGDPPQCRQSQTPEIQPFYDRSKIEVRRPLSGKARDCIRNMRQGRRLVGEYMEEFHNLVCCVDCLEEILVSWFKDRLNNDLYNAFVTQEVPAHLHDWYILAEEAEINQARN